MRFQIEVNGNPTNIGEKLPEVITHLNILAEQPHPMFKQNLNPQEIPLIKKWLNEIIPRLDLEDGYATYNNTLVKQEDISSFTL